MVVSILKVRHSAPHSALHFLKALLKVLYLAVHFWSEILWKAVQDVGEILQAIYLLESIIQKLTSEDGKRDGNSEAKSEG